MTTEQEINIAIKTIQELVNSDNQELTILFQGHGGFNGLTLAEACQILEFAKFIIKKQSVVVEKSGDGK